MKRCITVVGVVLAACGAQIGDDDGGDGDGGLDSGAGGGSGGSAYGDLSCDVVGLLADTCVSCHSNPPTQSAPFPLLSRGDLIAPSPSYAQQTIAQRSLTRMLSSTSPMPPAGNPVPSAAQLSAFQAWVTGGTPVGSCANLPDGGVHDGGVPDAGPVPTTCSSNQLWPNRYSGSSNMNPGLACIACHQGQNFSGQNPSHRSATREVYSYMGTVFPSRHEKDFCVDTPPAGAVVQILDLTGAVKQTITISQNRAGNFYADGTTNPYRARISFNGRTLTMTTAQTTGDCNTCHTEQGLNGAPGRLIFP